MILLAVLSGPVPAQSHDTSNDKPPAFDAADVHVSPFRRVPFMIGNVLRGDRYVLHQATMVDLIATAYGVDASTVQGGPIWLESDRFEVIAKAPATTPPATVKLMLQSLLADRFKLVIHRETKEMPVYALVVAKGGPKFAKLSESDHHGQVISQSDNQITGWARPMSDLANMLIGAVGAPVIDQTGLTGRFDLTLDTVFHSVVVAPNRAEPDLPPRIFWTRCASSWG